MTFTNTPHIPGPASCPNFYADDAALADRIRKANPIGATK